MNASSPSASPRRPLLRRLVPGLLLISLGGAAGAGLWHARARQQLADLEGQLVLAQANGNADAVGEIARRIARLDGSPSRLLALAECFVQVRLFDELERCLAEAENLAPERGTEVVRLRARAAAAKGEWEASIALWEQYLTSPAIAAPERVIALDALVAILQRQGRWAQASARIDARLALADGVAGRLARIQIAIRQRQWSMAREDFRHLQATASAEDAVKDRLPAWERLEREWTELEEADARVNAAPAALGARLVRAQLCARVGLWQNAADDLQQAAVAFPSARMPVLFGALLGLSPSFAKPEPPAEDFARALPWLASSKTLAGLLERPDEYWPKWGELAAIEVRLTDPTAGGGWTAQDMAYLRANRARILVELGLPEPALNEALEILRTFPGCLPAELVAIAAHLTRGNAVQAAAAVERALAAHATDPGAPDPELRRMAGLVWQAQGKHAQAVEALTACLAAARWPDLYRARAKSLRQLQRFAEAAQDVAAAEALEAVAGQEDVK
ncbi:MAG: hypothetical protein IPL39_01965 [Opitutaceae bacterium]|nr:hypothetical protein [Opitutaceae bacterium]